MSAPIQLQHLPSKKKPAPTRALLFLALLLVVVCSALSGCDAQAAPEQPLTKAELGAVKACGKGEVPVWIDTATHECMKERL